MPEGIEELYERQLTPMWRYVRARVPGDADAEDIVSEVFTRAVRDWRRFDPRFGSSTAWLFGIAHHVVADWWRSSRREMPAAGVEPDPGASGSPDPEASALAADDRRELRALLARLTDAEREAVALRFGAGLKSAEVGGALGISDAAARMLVYRAVTKLRKEMADG